MENDLSKNRSSSSLKENNNRKRCNDNNPSISRSRSSSPHKKAKRNEESCVSRKLYRNPKYSDLPLEWWERGEGCKDAKTLHVSKIDELCESREQLVLHTTLWKKKTVLEPNMFPCKCFVFV